jgi:hypothetical protein
VDKNFFTRGIKRINKRGFYVIILGIFRPPRSFPGISWASYRKTSSSVFISIISVIRIIRVFIINYFLVNIADFLFLDRSHD